MSDEIQVLSNNPPSAIDFAREVISTLNDWMTTCCPAITSEDDARQAKLLLDRAAEALRDVEDDRIGLVSPLVRQTQGINEKYKSLHNTDKTKPGSFDRVVNELKARLERYIFEQEQERQRIAEEAARRMIEAENRAREMEAQEQEILANAAVGEVGGDVQSATEQADQAFAEFEKAARAAKLAEREANVKIGGGFRRVVKLGVTEVLVIDDVIAAVMEIWPSEKLHDAILSCARVFRKSYHRLPEGIRATQERTLRR